MWRIYDFSSDLVLLRLKSEPSLEKVATIECGDIVNMSVVIVYQFPLQMHFSVNIK